MRKEGKGSGEGAAASDDQDRLGPRRAVRLVAAGVLQDGQLRTGTSMVVKSSATCTSGKTARASSATGFVSR